MGLPVNFNPYAPIPNDPFYSAQNWFIQGWQGPLVLGFGLNINFADGTINAGGSSSGTVNQIVAGTAITVSPTGGTGIVVVNNAGVTGLVAGTGISLSGGTGNITVTATGGSGTVTLINSGSGLSGGPITTSGTLALNYACVVDPTDYNAKGAILAGTGVGSYSALAVGLNGFLLTACSSAANGVCWTAAPAAGIPCACITGKGALVTGTAASAPVGLGVGANGQVLSANSACAVGLEWITPGAGTAATPLALGTVYACTENTGSYNTALGSSALLVAAGGAANVAIGASSGVALTTGLGNTLIGGGSACCLVDGQFNVANGYLALSAVTSGCFNIGVGANSGNALTTEGCNVVIGGHPGIVTQCNNVILSDGVGTLRLTLNSCGALSPDGTTFGTAGQILCSNGPTGQWNWTSAAGSPDATPVAAGVVLGCTTASLTALGCFAGDSITTSPDNVAIGCGALTSQIGGNGRNTAVGTGAASNLTGANNTMIGNCAARNATTASSTIAIGDESLGGAGPIVGSANVGVGNNTLYDLTGGGCNTAIGEAAGFNVTTGANNIAVGNTALGFTSAAVTGGCNIAIGPGSATALTTGNANIAIGSASLGNLTTGGCNISIGNSNSLGSTFSCFTTVIGNAITPFSSCSVRIGWSGADTTASFISGSSSWNVSSDARSKDNIVDFPEGLDLIEKLQPRSYDWIGGREKGEPGTPSFGLIAQEVAEAIAGTGADGRGLVLGSDEQGYGVSYASLVVPLINAVKELSARVKELEAK
jgi:hypothetical protein